MEVIQFFIGFAVLTSFCLLFYGLEGIHDAVIEKYVDATTRLEKKKYSSGWHLVGALQACLIAGFFVLVAHYNLLEGLNWILIVVWSLYIRWWMLDNWQSYLLDKGFWYIGETAWMDKQIRALTYKINSKRFAKAVRNVHQDTIIESEKLYRHLKPELVGAIPKFIVLILIIIYINIIL